MPRAVDVVSAVVIAPGAAGAAMAAVTGDALQVRNGAPGSLIRLIAMFSKAQAVGFTQAVWPSGNDTTRNLRYRNLANQPGNMIPRGSATQFRPQDIVSLTEAGSAVGGDVEFASMVVYYDDLPGIAPRYLSPDDVRSRTVRLLTVEDTTTATVATTYSGARALNAGSDLLRGDTDYAVLGAKIGATCQCLTIRGPDTALLRQAVPGLTSPDVETVNWFMQLSEWLGEGLVPVINSNNKASTFIENLQDENLTAVPFSLILAELTPG